MTSRYYLGIQPFLQILQQHNISFSLGGSALLVTLGLLPPSARRDWDILTDAPIDTVKSALKDIIYTQVSSKHPFASQFLLKCTYQKQDIDLIGSFALYDQNNQVFQLSSCPHFYVDDIPFANPREWQRAYAIMNRKEKADLLSEYIKNQSSKI